MLADDKDTDEDDLRIGRYRVLGPLGRGGMAQVDLAEAVGPGGFQKLVALKRILPDEASYPAFVQMFFDEARIAARIHHPNVVAIHDLGEDRGTYYMALEYVHGESLSVVMGRLGVKRPHMPHIPWPLVAYIGAQVSDGLHAAHELTGEDGALLGLVHRDVSPQNVLLSYDGFVKLSDFGIAKARGGLAPTQTGSLKGKLAYLSPEQANGQQLDRRSDVFALGIVLWEMAMGRRLFQSDDVLEMLQIVKTQRVPPPSEVIKDFPKSLEAVIMKALERDRDARWATAHQVHLALEDVVRSEGWTSTRHALGKFMHDLVPERSRMSPRERSAHIALAATELAESMATTKARSGTRRASVAANGIHAARTNVLVDPGAVAAAVGSPSVLTPTPTPTPVVVLPRRWPFALVVALLLAAAVGAAFAVFRAPSTAALLVESVPPGAEVYVDGEGMRGITPVSVPLDEGRHRVQLILDGHEPATRDVDVPEGGGSLRVDLRALAVADPPRPRSTPSAAEGSADHITKTATSPTPVEDQGEPNETRATRSGYLTIRTTPTWARVFVGERRLGETPIFRAPVAAGTHVLRLRVEGDGREIRQRVQVTAGAERRLTVALPH